ncbi:PD-(D/E)XK nuclease family protein [Erythrobacter sp. WG]|uniref:PD-(D/E)XK nuclease family protein n=1 Tax=Erythrobacter sp. WG TaxID=2985510 RepID=UPI00226D4638|nr:PD-(D/E)XK nuclease family protein [Erythrobacter sp. WG]MCX9147718.1 PD-(D/E)XK nuclease family protein [Erythrobacter sp. WG]
MQNCPVTALVEPLSVDVERLERAFQELRVLTRGMTPQPAKQSFDLGKIERAFQDLRQGLSHAKETGGIINPWSIVGLKRDEVRNAGALAGLWLPEFGGSVSKRFLAATLEAALPDIDWSRELEAGYRVETECSPMGDISDRVDLVIETTGYVIGIEVKIDAQLGPQQIERYLASLSRRAALLRRQSRVLLLAPDNIKHPGVPSITWQDVALAARSASRQHRAPRLFVEQLIAHFGDHVSAF